MREHGTYSMYTAPESCRCSDCRYAGAQYNAAYRAEQRRLIKLAREVERLMKGTR